MRPFRVVVPNPGSDDTLGLGQGLKPVLPDALFLQALDEPLHDAVLLRRVGRDELLGQTVASDGVRVALAGEDQAVVASQDDRLRGSSQMPETVDQRFFKGSFRCFGMAPGGEAPAQKFPAPAVDHKGQVTPLVPSAPDPGQVGGPTDVPFRGL